MKLINHLTTTVAIAIIGFALTATFADTATNAPAPTPPGPGLHGGRAPALDHLLLPKVVTNLKLAADQQTAYDSLDASFKKDAAKWSAENPIDPQAFEKAKESGDKEAMRQLREKRQGLMDIRKGYVEKLRASLTADQKKTLDESLAPHHHNHQQEKPASSTPPPAE